MAVTGATLGLQIFGTLFIILLAFLGMTAWIIRRIDRVADLVIDIVERLSKVEGQLGVAGPNKRTR